MNAKRLAIGLIALFGCYGFGWASHAQGISQHVAVCDPKFPTNCEAPGPGGGAQPLVVVTTDKSGTLTSGGAAQPAIALNAKRKGWCIQNAATASETLNVRVGGTASATTGTALAPGQQACNQPGLVDTAAVSVYAATTAHAWLGQEVQ